MGAARRPRPGPGQMRRRLQMPCRAPEAYASMSVLLRRADSSLLRSFDIPPVVAIYCLFNCITASFEAGGARFAKRSLLLLGVRLLLLLCLIGGIGILPATL